MSTHRSLLSAAGIALAAAIGAGVASMPAAQDDTPTFESHDVMASPSEHHKWLQQLVGTWSIDSEMTPGEGAPSINTKGSDTVRSLGGRWVVCEHTYKAPGMDEEVHAMLTLGYNADTGKYQGTWVDSMTDLMWVYEGTLDPTGKILTLEAMGPNLMDPTATEKIKFRDVIEVKSEDHRTLASSAFMEGKWVQFMKAEYRRTK